MKFNLATTSFKILSPRTIHLEVKNQRRINEEAGNTHEVEKAVKKAVGAALTRGGITVNNTSKNYLTIMISDYDGYQQGECVKIRMTLNKMGWMKSAEGYGCQEMKHITGIKMGGNITEAYRMALNVVLKELEAQ